MDKENIIFDNNDSRIKYYELLLEKDLTEMPEINLPESYRFVFYKDGDKDAWINIEKSAREFDSYSKGAAAWEKYYGTRLKELPGRMVFIENAEGLKVATATAFYNIYRQDSPLCGWLHWVAIKREYQGQGLSKPLVLFTLNIMKKLGYTHSKIPTQTNTWLACKVYLDLGFLPVKENAVHSSYGWRIVKTLTGHPSLKDFNPVSLEEVIV
ncbi:MAG: GNAT family N-acetyltransferase [Lachnospiraceae bacterium]